MESGDQSTSNLKVRSESRHEPTVSTFDEESRQVRVTGTKRHRTTQSREEFLEKRRTLNRVNARKSRLRKTFLIETLKQQWDVCVKQAQHLRDMVGQHMEESVEDILGKAPVPLSDVIEDAMFEAEVEEASSGATPQAGSGDLEDEEARLNRKRDINRINARKSRLRKKAQINGIEARLESINKENSILCKALSEKLKQPESSIMNTKAVNGVIQRMQNALQSRLTAEDARARREKKASIQAKRKVELDKTVAIDTMARRESVNSPMNPVTGTSPIQYSVQLNPPQNGSQQQIIYVPSQQLPQQYSQIQVDGNQHVLVNQYVPTNMQTYQQQNTLPVHLPQQQLQEATQPYYIQVPVQHGSSSFGNPQQNQAQVQRNPATFSNVQPGQAIVYQGNHVQATNSNQNFQVAGNGPNSVERNREAFIQQDVLRRNANWTTKTPSLTGSHLSGRSSDNTDRSGYPSNSTFRSQSSNMGYQYRESGNSSSSLGAPSYSGSSRVSGDGFGSNSNITSSSGSGTNGRSSDETSGPSSEASSNNDKSNSSSGRSSSSFGDHDCGSSSENRESEDNDTPSDSKPHSDSSGAKIQSTSESSGRNEEETSNEKFAHSKSSRDSKKSRLKNISKALATLEKERIITKSSSAKHKPACVVCDHKQSTLQLTLNVCGYCYQSVSQGKQHGHDHKIIGEGKMKNSSSLQKTSEKSSSSG